CLLRFVLLLSIVSGGLLLSSQAALAQENESSAPDRPVGQEIMEATVTDAPAVPVSQEAVDLVRTEATHEGDEAAHGDDGHAVHFGIIFAMLALVLVAGKIGNFVERYGQPAVIGELLAG